MFSRGRAALQVVGGNSFNGPVLPGFGVTIGNGLGASDGLDHCWRRQNVCICLANFLDGIRVHVVPVNVGNQNEGLRLGVLENFTGLAGSRLDSLSSGLDQCA